MLSCFQKADIGDIIHFAITREYMVVSLFDGYKVRAINLETYRIDDVCVGDIPYMKKIVKAFLKPPDAPLP